MGLFFDKVQDALDAANKGDTSTAVKILQQHIKKEHQFERSLSETLREAQAYQHALVAASRYLEANSTKKKGMDSLKFAHMSLMRFETQIKSLIDEGKLELRDLKTLPLIH